MTYDALLVLSFGGPETREDVLPFLRNVLGDGTCRKSACWKWPSITTILTAQPINQQNRELVAALEKELEQHGRSCGLLGNRTGPHILSTRCNR